MEGNEWGQRMLFALAIGWRAGALDFLPNAAPWRSVKRRSIPELGRYFFRSLVSFSRPGRFPWLFRASAFCFWGITGTCGLGLGPPWIPWARPLHRFIFLLRGRPNFFRCVAARRCPDINRKKHEPWRQRSWHQSPSLYFLLLLYNVLRIIQHLHNPEPWTRVLRVPWQMCGIPPLWSWQHGVAKSTDERV